MRRCKRRKRTKKGKSDKDAVLDEAMAQTQSEADGFLQHINETIDKLCDRGQTCPKGHRLRAGRAQVHGYCGFCGGWGHPRRACRKDPGNRQSGRPQGASKF